MDAAERNQVILSLVLDDRNEQIPKFAKLLNYLGKEHPNLFDAVHINTMLAINHAGIRGTTWNVVTYATESNQEVLQDVNKEKLYAFILTQNMGSASNA